MRNSPSCTCCDTATCADCCVDPPDEWLVTLWGFADIDGTTFTVPILDAGTCSWFLEHVFNPPGPGGNDYLRITVSYDVQSEGVCRLTILALRDRPLFGDTLDTFILDWSYPNEDCDLIDEEGLDGINTTATADLVAA